MLPREKRLRKNAEFDTVYKSGRYFSEKFLTLYVLKNGAENVRCGFSISKKVSKKATTRNKIKRQLSHIFREELSLINVNGFDLIFVARKSMIDIEFFEIKKSVCSLLKRANFYLK